MGESGEKSDSMREKEMQASIAAASVYPGFKFSPTDEELISYYLNKKSEGSDSCVGVIAEVEINTFEPWDLPAKSVIQSDNEWFFFSPRGRKYPNGSQSKRATKSGYWKATGKERNVKFGSNIIGTKRTLVFHTGRAPKGERTEWIMHEYSMAGRSQDSMVICRLRRNSEFRLNECSRQGSSNQRHRTADSKSHRSLSESGVEPSNLPERSKAVESNSKDNSNSYNSHSFEHSENEFEQRPENEFSQIASSSQKDDEYEECFADILKNDIVDLGKPTLPPKPVDNQRWQQLVQNPLHLLPPLQGTAHRRIRLNWDNQEDQRPVVIESTNEDNIEKIMNPKPPTSKCVISFLSHQTLRDRWLYIVGGLFTMLVAYLFYWGVPLNVKRFMRIT